MDRTGFDHFFPVGGDAVNRERLRHENEEEHEEEYEYAEHFDHEPSVRRNRLKVFQNFRVGGFHAQFGVRYVRIDPKTNIV